MERDAMLVRNAVMPPVRPKMQGQHVTLDEAWLNDVGPLSRPLQPKVATHKTQEAVARYGGCVDHAPLERLLKDESISEITCIGPRRTYVERNGLLEEVQCYFASEGQMVQVIEQMLLSVGHHLQSGWPIIAARLSNGIQLHAVLPPNAVNGPILTLHKHVKEPLTLADLVSNGTLSQA